MQARNMYVNVLYIPTLSLSQTAAAKVAVKRERSGNITQCVQVISHEHYRGYEINRCEEDQIRKRRGRYDDSGIIAYGGYVELSRET